MIQTNTLPDILDSHGSYAIELEESDTDVLNVVFAIDNDEPVSIRYRAYEGKATIQLDVILQSAFDILRNDSYDYLEDEIKPFKTLNVYVGDLEFNFKLVESALQLGDGDVLEIEQLMAYSTMPLFVGYPKSSHILKPSGVVRVLNSKGCPEVEVDPSVKILIYKDGVEIATAQNAYQLDLPDESESNGFYQAVFSNVTGDVISQEFRVINGGIIVMTNELDMFFVLNTEVLEENEYGFIDQTYTDEIKVKVSTSLEAEGLMKFTVTNPNGDVWESSTTEQTGFTINPFVEMTDRNYAFEINGYHTIAVEFFTEGTILNYQEGFVMRNQSEGISEAGILDDIIFFEEDFNNEDFTREYALIDLSQSGSNYMKLVVAGVGADSYSLSVLKPSGESDTIQLTDNSAIFTPLRDINQGNILTESGVYTFTARAITAGQAQSITRRITLNIVQ